MWLTSYDIEPRWGRIEVNLVAHASIGQRSDWERQVVAMPHSESRDAGTIEASRH